VSANPSPQQPILSVIVPTYNERDNVAPLLAALDAALPGVPFETIFVDDDSPDGTAAEVKRLAVSRADVRCLRRVGRRGLSSATIEGMLSSAAEYVAVIDGDLQHDANALKPMLAAVKDEGFDLAVGSRYVDGGVQGGLSFARDLISRGSGALARLVLRTPLKDPMSGFFLLRRANFDVIAPRLSGQGFKILADICASAPEPLRAREVPYHFGPRLAGESKLDNRVALDFALMLIDKTLGHLIPLRFISFAAVGSLGLIVHLAMLGALFKMAGVEFGTAQTAATFIAMTSNYALNNIFTYGDQRRRGWRFVTGLLGFYAICWLGVMANVSVANMMYGGQSLWWVAGGAGALIGAVWNYAASSVFVWPGRK